MRKCRKLSPLRLGIPWKLLNCRAMPVRQQLFCEPADIQTFDRHRWLNHSIRALDSSWSKEIQQVGSLSDEYKASQLGLSRCVARTANRCQSGDDRIGRCQSASSSIKSCEKGSLASRIVRQASSGKDTPERGVVGTKTREKGHRCLV